MLQQGGALLLIVQVALASCAADDEAFHAVLNLVLDVPVERRQVNLAVLRIRRLDRSDEPGFLDALQVHCLLVGCLRNGNLIEH